MPKVQTEIAEVAVLLSPMPQRLVIVSRDYFLLLIPAPALRDLLCFENRVPKVKNVPIEVWIVRSTTTIGYALIFVAEGESPLRITKELHRRSRT